MIITLGSIYTLASRARQHPARFFDALNMSFCYNACGGQLLIFNFIYSQSYVWPPARRQSGVLFCVLSIFVFATLIKEAASIVAKFITYIS